MLLTLSLNITMGYVKLVKVVVELHKSTFGEVVDQVLGEVNRQQRKKKIDSELVQNL